MSGQQKIYDMVTDTILSKLEEGVVPWQKPWTGPANSQPYNLKTKKPYRGINVLLLGMAGYSSRYWLSFKQAQQMGGSIRKGEKGHLCVFWKIFEKTVETESGESVNKTIPMLRYYKVFNLDQVEGIEDPDTQDQTTYNNFSIEYCDSLMNNMPQKPQIKHVEQRAYYSPISDTVNLPKFETFVNSESYYATAFHELVHSTGHQERLNRKEVVRSTYFGSEDYSFEELVAEIGSSFLCAESGIWEHQADNSAAYIQGWIEQLKNNRNWVVQAAGKAQKATDFILNK